MDIFSYEPFRDMLSGHALEVIDLLTISGTPFTVVCGINDVEFDPQLPASITERFKPLTLFALDGYTLSTAQIDWDNETLVFEAGFGEENVGAFVTIPCYAIFQIAIDENIIFHNPTVTYPTKKPKKKRVVSDASEEKSLKSFLANPDNSKFFRNS